ncbi:hypothetical protein Ahu01nite_047050 [Winogradskya humida]|uniref:HTH cro/C1-type domain-containing protein n=2 Tax=Winogradskya humida TaxID=113566 RepID=A0ABQ3ZSS1_9ACTN|nr:hypothetical protein Ahu01nite_047050 [Actinoplanes humidus]
MNATVSSDPFFDLRHAIRRLYLHAGEPSLRSIASRTHGGISHATASEVLRSIEKRRWGQIEVFVSALGGDVEIFHGMWVTAREKQERQREEHPGSAPEPTVTQVLMGIGLRRHREARGISRAAAAEALGLDENTVGSVEAGRRPLPVSGLAPMLDLYGVDKPRERERLTALLHTAHQPGRLDRFFALTGKEPDTYQRLAAEAEMIRIYEPKLVPAMLQTREYAKAVQILGTSFMTEEKSVLRSRVHMARQRILENEKPPKLWVVLDQAVLHPGIGDRRVMRNQIQHLLTRIRSRGLCLQVHNANWDATGVAAPGFSVLRLRDPETPDIVQVEQLTSDIYLDSRDDVDPYVAMMMHMVIDAEPPGRSLALLNRLHERLLN